MVDAVSKTIMFRYKELLSQVGYKGWTGKSIHCQYLQQPQSMWSKRVLVVMQQRIFKNGG